MDFFVKHLKATRSGFVIMLIMQGVLFLFGFIMVVVINATVNHDRDYALLGSMMALMASLFGGLLRGNGGMNRYRRAVSMGHTRLSYMLTDPVITALNCAAGIVFAWILGKLELLVYHVLYPGWEMDFDAISMMKWWHFLLFILGVCVLDYFLGAVQLRFGTKGFAVIWFPLCFSGVFINATVGAAREGRTSLLSQLGRGMIFVVGLLRPAMWAAVGIAILLALLALSTVWYRKAEIRI